MFGRLFGLFQANGKALYHVGGSVRDMLRGESPKDFDFTTDALPDETTAILNSDKDYIQSIWPIGEKFGTIAAVIEGQPVEITTHRRDMTPGRHPDVAFTKDLSEDLARRDFTINSMALTNVCSTRSGSGWTAARALVSTSASTVCHSWSLGGWIASSDSRLRSPRTMAFVAAFCKRSIR